MVTRARLPLVGGIKQEEPSLVKLGLTVMREQATDRHTVNLIDRDLVSLFISQFKVQSTIHSKRRNLTKSLPWLND